MTLTVEELTNRVRRLESLLAIQTLKARYLSSCDRQDPDSVRDCLLPNGALIAYEGFPEFNDRDAFVEVFRTMGCQPGIYDMHHGCNPAIEIDEDGLTATGKWSLFFQNINLAGRTVMQMGLEYDDVYKFEAGRWWIAETRTRRTSFLMEVIDEEGNPKVVAMGEAPAVFGEMPDAG